MCSTQYDNTVKDVFTRLDKGNERCRLKNSKYARSNHTKRTRVKTTLRSTALRSRLNNSAKKLGLETVPCVRADDLTKDQVKAYRILDNKLNELATWDFATLQAELNNFDYQLGELDKYLSRPSTESYVVFEQGSPTTDERTENQEEVIAPRYTEPAQKNYEYVKDMKQEFTPLSNDDRLKLIVHFKNASDIVEFGEKIGVPLSEGVKTVLF